MGLIRKEAHTHAIEIITSSCSDVIKLEHTATSTSHASPAAADSEFTALLENNFYALCSHMHIQFLHSAATAEY